MSFKQYNLVDIIRDPGLWIYETFELTHDGHYYLYRYDASEGAFYRATVPAGAAAPHFYLLREGAKVPIGGWQRLERKISPTVKLRLVAGKKR